MRIIRTARAEEDLIEIWSYIARDNERAADRTLDELEKRTRLLGRYPMLGRKRLDIGAGVRSFVSGSYLILYRVGPEHLEVARYIHVRRELKGLV